MEDCFQATKGNTLPWVFSRFLNSTNGTKSRKNITNTYRKGEPVVALVITSLMIFFVNLLNKLVHDFRMTSYAYCFGILFFVFVT